jgi:bacterioferritin
MQGDKAVLDVLNRILTNELTAINQYFLHARTLEQWGYEKLGHKTYEASIDEMKDADEIVKRILFLEGLPNLQEIGKLNVGEDVEEIIKADLALEMKAIPVYREAIEICEKKDDFVTRRLLAELLKGEEHQADWLETQVELIEAMGLQNYLQSQV